MVSRESKAQAALAGGWGATGRMRAQCGESHREIGTKGFCMDGRMQITCTILENNLLPFGASCPRSGLMP